MSMNKQKSASLSHLLISLGNSCVDWGLTCFKTSCHFFAFSVQVWLVGVSPDAADVDVDVRTARSSDVG